MTRTYALNIFNRACLLLLLFATVSTCKKDDAPRTDDEVIDRTGTRTLPLFTISTNAEIVDEPKVDGRLILSDSVGILYEGNIAIEKRGASSQAFFEKQQYGFETRDADNADLDVSLLSYPEEEDWILNGPYSDKSLVRNHLIYNLARDMGHYASRTELVELNLNGSFDGLYVFMEKLKRDKARIDISKLNPEDIEGEELTGGYIIKIDKAEGSDSGGYSLQNSFVSNVPPVGSNQNQSIRFLFDYPDASDIVPEQRTYIQDYIANFENSLASTFFTDPVSGYANYIDVDSFIDFFILNELSNNVDGYRLSTFLHKDKGEKLKAGPIWDFNLAFGNADYCSGGAVNVWAYKFNERCPDDFWQVPFWWDRLLQDPAYVAKLKERWNNLRGGVLSNNAIQGKIDSYVAMMQETKAIENNFKRWDVLGIYVWPNNFVGNNYIEEVNYLRSWIEDRLSWLDGSIEGL